MTRSVYYWRTTFALTDSESALLRRSHITRVYLRLFDVAWNGTAGRALPVGPCAFRQPVPRTLDVVPVVYVANRVFENEPDPAALATRVWQRARAMASEGGFSFREIQIDCDWSEGTRQAFFSFCRSLGSLAHAADSTRVSATIRLHQIKYPARTGIPPVDRGMLMFYNMGTLTAAPARSSIFNADDASRYVSFVDRYPLPLDAALAVFSWAIQGRGDRVVGLLDKINVAALSAVPALRQRAPQRYVAAQPTYFRGGYLQAGDTLALETMTPALSLQSATLLAKYFHPRGALALALFDLDERNLKDYAPSDLDALYSAVR